MAQQIESGGGNRDTAIVTEDGRLNVSSRSTSRIYFQSRFGGRAYSWSNVSYNYDAGDTILLIKNTSVDRSLVISSITISGDTTSLWTIHTGTTNITPTGTAVTGVNTNRKDTVSATATAIADETANTQGDIVWNGRILANTPYVVGQDIIGDSIRLGTNHFIGVDVATDGGAANVTIFGYFETDSAIKA